MSVIVLKSEALAVRIVRLYQHLVRSKNERVMSKQLLRSGTSIGANVAEAHAAQSDADFLAKMHIALKECNESRYWCKLLFSTDYLNCREFDSLSKDLNEVFALLTSIIRTTKARL